MASPRGARRPIPLRGSCVAFEDALRTLRSAKEPRAFQRAAHQYRRIVNDEYAGPRLHAAIRASQGMIPHAFLLSYPNVVGDMLAFYEDETAAIRRREPADAKAACARCADLMAKVMVSELVRRGVLAPSEQPAVAF